MRTTELEVRDLRVAGAAMLGAAAVLPLLPGAPGLVCPLRALTGVPCPLCGMTTSVESILQLRLGEAFAADFRYTDTWPAAIHMVASGAVDLDSLVTGRFGLERAAEALDSDLDQKRLQSVVYPNSDQ